jgi:hypothetical protein
MNDLLKTINNIKSITADPRTFLDNFTTLGSLSDSLNSQITSHLYNVKRLSIETIINESIARINWDVMRSKLEKDLKNPRTPLKLTWTYSIDDIIDFDIDLFEDDVFTVMYDALSEENPKEYNHAFRSVGEDLARILRDLKSLDVSMQLNVNRAIDDILKYGSELLYELHYAYVIMLRNKYDKIPEFEIVSGCKIPFNKSQREFFSGAIKIMNDVGRL